MQYETVSLEFLGDGVAYFQSSFTCYISRLEFIYSFVVVAAKC
jgi:hypothetical protein